MKTYRVYVINLELIDDIKGSDDYSDEEFINIAELQGGVYSLSGFQDTYNYTEKVSSANNYIRILKTK